MNPYITSIIGIVIFMSGFAYGSLSQTMEHIDSCTSFNKNGVEWKGFRAISEDNERRCFFMEQRYPYRVWQGVEKA